MKILRKMIAVLLFLWDSRQAMIVEYGGPINLFMRLWKCLLSRASLGDMLSQMAYMRRADPKVYERWIRRVENRSSDPTSGLIHLLVRVDEGQKDAFLSMLSSIEKNERVGTLWVYGSISNESIQSCSLASDKAVIHLSVWRELLQPPIRESDKLLVLSAPALVEWQRLGMLERSIEEGAGVVLFDHDHWIDNKRCHPVFKPVTFDEYLLVRPEYKECALTTLGALNGLPEDLDADVLATLMLMQKVRVCPSVLVHFLAVPTMSSLKPTDVYETDLCSVSIVIPTRDRLDLLDKCVDSILANLGSIRPEIVVVDNGSVEEKTLEWLSAATESGKIKVVTDSGEFNWSRLCNEGIKASSGEVLIMLNNDIEIRSIGWLEALTARALRPDVGVVGAQLRYANGSIQHAGTVLGYGGAADHVYMHSQPNIDQWRYFPPPSLDREVSACTGACQVFRRSHIDQYGYYDESLNIVGDVEWCVRLRNQGLHNVYVGKVYLIHHESQSRKAGLPDGDYAAVKKLNKELPGRVDPHFHPEISLQSRYPMPRLFSNGS